MSRRWRLAALVLLALLGLANLWQGLAGPSPRWYRGALHVHTVLSDGTATPREMVEAYRGAGFDFVTLTDHDVLPFRKPSSPPDLADLRDLQGDPSMLVVGGEEVSCQVEGRPVHLNVWNLGRPVGSSRFATAVEALRWTLDRVEGLRSPGQPSLLQLNHPNFRGGVSVEDLLQFPEIRLFEVYNPHDGWTGDATRPAIEGVWDLVLAQRFRGPERRPLYGTAVDDAHRAPPGTIGGTGNGWVMVQAERLDTGSLLEALRTGRFYASTGVELERVEASGGLALEIRPREGASFRTLFVGTRRDGPAGEVLASVEGPSPSYRFTGDELYVRARVESSLRQAADRSRFEAAWTQPLEGPACPWPAAAGPGPEAPKEAP